MALASAVTVQQMIDGIKVEGRITGADTYDVTILGIINELLVEHTEKERYSVFIVRDQVVPLTAGEGSYDLPDNLQNIKKVYWSRVGQPVRARVLNYKNDYVEESRDGREPKYYELSGDQITVFPYSDVKTTDTMSIDYWKVPDALVPTDVFPVAKLFPVIKKETIARMLRLNKEFGGDDRFTKQADETAGKQQTTEDNSDN